MEVRPKNREIEKGVKQKKKWITNAWIHPLYGMLVVLKAGLDCYSVGCSGFSMDSKAD